MRRPEGDRQKQGIAFIPIAAEPFGGWLKPAESKVRNIVFCLFMDPPEIQQSFNFPP